jgi:hypothetical protein
MDGQLTVIQSDINSLLFQIREVVKEELQNKYKTEVEEKLLSPDKAKDLFIPAISRQTLSNWTKDGLLNSYRIGGRVYYKSSEIMDAAKELRRFKKH